MEIKPEITRRQFLKFAGLATAGAAAALVAEELGKKQRLWAYIRTIFDQFPWNNDFSGISTNPVEVKKRLEGILPKDNRQGGAFIAWEGNQLIYSGSNLFPHGSLIKSVLAAYALKKGFQLTESDWHQLLIESSDETQIKIANQILEPKGKQTSKDERIALYKHICQSFGMVNTDAFNGCLNDYFHFWEGIFNCTLLNSTQKEQLLNKLSSSGMADAWHRGGIDILAALSSLESPGKIGVAVEAGQTTHSTILAFLDRRTKKPLVIGGCFFTGPKNDSRAIDHYVDFHQLALALAASQTTSNGAAVKVEL